MPSRKLRWLTMAGLLLALVVTTASAWLRLGLEGRVCGGVVACSAGTLLAAETPVRLIHRLAASTETLVVLALGVLAWRDRRRRPAQAWAAAAALVALVFLAVLGAQAGGSRLPVVTLGNLIGGFALIGALGALHALAAADRPRLPASTLQRAATVALVLLLLQVALGALASAGFAGVECRGGPACADAWASTSVLAQMNPWTIRIGSDARAIAAPAAIALLWIHRVLGFVAGGYLLWFAYRLRHAGCAGAGRGVATLVGLQIVVAASPASPALPVSAAVVHNLLAALLVLSLSSIAARLR